MLLGSEREEFGQLHHEKVYLSPYLEVAETLNSVEFSMLDCPDYQDASILGGDQYALQEIYH